MEEFAGKVAVVTGGGSGIGRAIAESLASEGMRVVVADIDGASATETADLAVARGAEAWGRRTDVTDLEDVKRLAEEVRERFGPVDVLCNNAGVMSWHHADEASHTEWEWIVSVNLWGVIHGIETFLPQLKEGGRPGHIVNTASMAGVTPSAISSLYSTTKYAVVGLSETLRDELREDRIGVTVLCPGAVRTRLRETTGQTRPADVASPDDGPARPGLGAAFEPREPEEVGRMVVDAIRHDRPYIFTDARLRNRVEERYRQVLAAFDHAGSRAAGDTA